MICEKYKAEVIKLRKKKKIQCTYSSMKAERDLQKKSELSNYNFRITSSAETAGTRSRTWYDGELAKGARAANICTHFLL